MRSRLLGGEWGIGASLAMETVPVRASGNATIQAQIAQSTGGNYGLGLAAVAGLVAIAVALITWFGREAKGVPFGAQPTRRA